MTKRKRDVFTIIISINNWFEASEHYTNSTADHEGVSSGSDRITDPRTNITVNCQAAECPKPVSNTEHGDEVGHESSSCLPSSVELGV